MAEMRPAEAHGFWVGRGDRAFLCWMIDGQFVSDRALRRWVYQNMVGIAQHVGVCVLKMHTDAYAASLTDNGSSKGGRDV